MKHGGAVAVFAADRATQTGFTIGMPAFMSPEHARAKPEDIDARTDLWAVGATIFTLASGETVHEAENAQALQVLAATMPARLTRFATRVLPARCALRRSTAPSRGRSRPHRRSIAPCGVGPARGGPAEHDPAGCAHGQAKLLAAHELDASGNRRWKRECL